MKSLLFVFVTLPLFLQAQPKKTNTIEVKNATLMEGAKQLVQDGYLIDKMDTTLGFVYSKPKGVRGNTVIINLAQKDSSLVISGVGDMQMEVNVGMFTSKASSFPIEYRGQKGSSLRICWEEMNRFAKSFGKEVSYYTR